MDWTLQATFIDYWGNYFLSYQLKKFDFKTNISTLKSSFLQMFYLKLKIVTLNQLLDLKKPTFLQFFEL